MPPDQNLLAPMRSWFRIGAQDTALRGRAEHPPRRAGAAAHWIPDVDVRFLLIAPFVRAIESAVRIAVSVASCSRIVNQATDRCASCRSWHQFGKLLRLQCFQSHFDPFRLPRIGRRRVVGEADSVRSVDSEFDVRPQRMSHRHIDVFEPARPYQYPSADSHRDRARDRPPLPFHETTGWPETATDDRTSQALLTEHNVGGVQRRTQVLW